MIAMFPRYYLKRRWTEDGVMLGLHDSWTGLGPTVIGFREDMIKLTRMHETHARKFEPHSCYDHIHEVSEFGCTVVGCGICDIIISITIRETIL